MILDLLSLLFVFISVVAGLYFVRKMPAANWMLFVANGALSTIHFWGPINSSRILYGIQFLTLISLAFHRDTPQFIHSLPKKLEKSPFRTYTLAIFIVWVMILAVTLYQRTPYQLTMLKNCLLVVVWPILTLLLSLRRFNSNEVARQAILGMCFFSAIAVLYRLSFLIGTGAFHHFLSGDGNLIVGNKDYLSGGLIYFYGALGFTVLPIIYRYRPSVLIGSLAAFCVFLLTLFMLGARQYALGVAVLWLLMIMFELRRYKKTLFIVIIAFTLFGDNFIQRTKHTKLVERFMELPESASRRFGRITIWRDAWDTGLNNPFWGVGFRNYGEIQYRYDYESGDYDIGRDSAHGFMQTIMAEHGMIVFSFVLLAFLYLLYVFIRRVLKKLPDSIRAIFYIAVAISIHENFSYVVANSLGYNLLAITPWLVSEWISPRTANGSSHETRETGVLTGSLPIPEETRTDVP